MPVIEPELLDPSSQVVRIDERAGASTPLFQPFPMLGRRRAQAWRYQPQYRRPVHFHPESELNVVLRGSARFRVGERVVDARAGHVVWLPPAVEHGLLDASADLEFFVAGFAPAFVETIARIDACAVDFSHRTTRLDAGELRDIELGWALANDRCDDVAVENLLGDWLRRLSSPSASRSPTAALGLRAAREVLLRPQQSRAQLARLFASNRGDVSRRFHDHNALTFREYRKRALVLAFLRLVDGGRANWTRAALEAGFGSYSQCHRVFRSVMGLSPRQFFAGGRTELAQRYEPIGAVASANEG